MGLKMEISTRDHFSVLPIERRPVTGRQPVVPKLPMYHIHQLLRTKMSVLHEGTKGRGVCDIRVAK